LEFGFEKSVQSLGGLVLIFFDLVDFFSGEFAGEDGCATANRPSPAPECRERRE
jgi:hypothetical protein